MSENNIIIEETEKECESDYITLLKDKAKNNYINTISAIKDQTSQLMNKKKNTMLASQKILKLKILNEESKKNSRAFSSSKNVTQDSNDCKNEEIESLRYQLNEEKIKSEVLKVIAEDEKKKHLYYRAKFQKVKNINDELIDKMKKTRSNNRCSESRDSKKHNNSSNLEIIKETITFNLSNINNNTINHNTSLDFNESLVSKDLKEKLKTINDLNSKIETLTKELNKTNEDNTSKSSLIKKLYKKVEELQENKNTLISENQRLSREIKRLNQEIAGKNTKITNINNLLEDEKKSNEQNYKKIAELLNKNEEIMKEFNDLKEQNKKLYIQVYGPNAKQRDSITAKNAVKKEKEKIVIEAKNIINQDNESYEMSDKSLGINKMKDMSDISCIPKKQQQIEDDTTLNDLFSKNPEKESKPKKKKRNHSKKNESKSCSDSDSSSSSSSDNEY